MDILRNLYTSPNIPKPSNVTSLSDVLALALNVIVGVGFSVGIISVAYSGILYATSSGDPKNTKKAWEVFLWGAIAFMVTLGSFVIKNAILVKLFQAESGYGNNVPNL